MTAFRSRGTQIGTARRILCFSIPAPMLLTGSPEELFKTSAGCRRDRPARETDKSSGQVSIDRQ